MSEAGARLDREQRLRIARECTYFNTRKATRVLGDLFDGAMRPLGLKGTQFSLLVAISLADTPTVGQLAGILGADRTTLTRTLAPLERDGLIESVPVADRRKRRLRLTSAGEDLMNRAAEKWRETQREIVDGMGSEAWQGLMSALRTVHDLAQATDERGQQGPGETG